MSSGIINSFKNLERLPLTESEKVKIAELLESNTEILAKDTLIKTDVEPHIYYLEEGIVRMYGTNPKSGESNITFIFKGDFFLMDKGEGMMDNFELQYGTLTKVRLRKISKREIIEITGSEIEYLKFERSVYDTVFVKAFLFYLEFLHLNSYDRYDRFVSRFGEDVVKDISIKHLASFFGIFPESLTRIRRERRKKSNTK